MLFMKYYYLTHKLVPFLVFPRAGYRAVRGVLAGQQDFPTALAMATFLGNIAALYLVVST